MDADFPEAASGVPGGDPWAATAVRGPAPRPSDDALSGAMGSDGVGGPNHAEDAELQSPRAQARRRWRWVVEWSIVLVVALAVALVVRAFVVQTFFIPSASMEPTLMIGDRILVDKLSYHLHAVHRGDMVVFGRPPGEQASENVQDLVKRVVGLPGETIWSSAAGQVFVQGPDTGNKVVMVPEPVPGTQLGPAIHRFTLPKGDYYVLGDNRTNSDDSRYFGPIPRSLIVGRVVMRIWPVTQMKFF